LRRNPVNYIEVDDDTGSDAAADIITRAMTGVHPAVGTGAVSTPAGTEPEDRDLQSPAARSTS
jgi:hypothetical protein